MNKLTKSSSTTPSSYELEHELRYRIPKSVFVQLMASPYRPFTIVDRVLIKQLWTYNDGSARSRIRELTDNNGNVTYTACTKYKLSADNQLEFEQPITPTEFAQIRSLYPKVELEEKVRFYLKTPENPNFYVVADLRVNSDEAIIELECPRGERVIIPKWLKENGEHIGVVGKQVR